MPETMGMTGVDVDDRRPLEEELEEGELYVFRKGKLNHVLRDEEDGMRRVRITEEAYQAAMDVGKRMRKTLHGYKPDVSLVVSALVINGNNDVEDAQEAVKKFVLDMFSRASGS